MVTAIAALALLAALGMAAVWTVRGGSDGTSAAHPSSSPVALASASPTAGEPRLTRLEDVEAHQGETVTLRYRLAAGGPSTPVTLVVEDAGGERVKARRLAGAEAGRWVSARVPLDLEPGRYTYALLLGENEAASSAATASSLPAAPASAALRVLPPLPPPFPGVKAVAAAKEWVAWREGEAAFAVVDTNGDEAGGYRQHEPFQLASLAKAVLLVASLRKDPTPDAATEETLTRMITESDNGAAYAVFDRIGAAGMRKVARLAGLRDYEQGSDWIDTRASAWDAAHLFSQLEKLVPAAGRPLARRLLGGVVPVQRWGIPAAAGPAGWTAYFKGGWLGEDNRLMVQAAWLEKGERRWALAVMSDENPTRSSGWETQKGVTGLLLGEEPTPAYLAVVLE